MKPRCADLFCGAGGAAMAQGTITAGKVWPKRENLSSQKVWDYVLADRKTIWNQQTSRSCHRKQQTNMKTRTEQKYTDPTLESTQYTDPTLESTLNACKEMGFGPEITNEVLWNTGYALGRKRWHWGPWWMVTFYGWIRTQIQNLTRPFRKPLT